MHLCLVKMAIDRPKRLDSSVALISCSNCYGPAMSVEKSIIVEALGLGTFVVLQLLDRMTCFHETGGRYRFAPDIAEIAEYYARLREVKGRFGELDPTIADSTSVRDLSDVQRAQLNAYMYFIGSFLDWQRRHWGGK